MSVETFSSGCPLCSATISSIPRLSAIASRAWISMSLACPSKPPRSWWIRIFAFGSAIRLPFTPAASRSAPSDIAIPTEMVVDRGLDELHRVVDREAGVDRAAGAVDVERDVLVGVVGLEMEQLGDRQVGELVVDRRAEEDDPLVEEARVDVEGALAVYGLLDHHRDQRAHRFPPAFQAFVLRLQASHQVALVSLLELLALELHRA